MKKSLFLLAMAVMSTALYAQGENTPLTQEQVLDVFARFNPSVLEKAKQNPTYKTTLDNFVSSIATGASSISWIDLVAAARNFENSLQLNQITKKYQQLWLAAKMSGADTTVADENFSSEVASVFSRVWAVTVQLRRYQLDQAKAERNELAHAQDKTEAEVQEAKERLNSAITLLKAEIKTLQYKPGVQIQSAAQEYTSRVQRRLQENTFSVQQAQAAQDEQAAQQSTNLQIKSNHKKPVAK